MAGTIKHEWNGTILTITSDSGTSSADLRGVKGDTGSRGVRGLPGERGGGAAIEDGIISTETTWSSSAIMDNFAEKLAVNGNPVQCNPIPNYPLHIITDIEPKQSGSGEASPTNIRPISGMDAVNVVRCGKNLLDVSAAAKATNCVSSITNDGKITIKGSLSAQWSNTHIGVFNMIAGKTYTISGVLGYGRIGFSTQSNIIPGSSANPNITGATAADIINSGRSSATFTANETITVYVWYCSDSGTNKAAFTMGLQIEKGSTATTFEPYNGNTFTLSLGETIYGGSLDWNTGVLTIDKGYLELTGNEIQGTSTVSSTTGENANMCLWLSTNDMAYGNFQEGYCSHLYNDRAMRNRNTIRFGALSGGNYTRTIYIYLHTSDFADLAAFKSYAAAQAAAGTPIKIVYPLAEPRKVQLTEQEIKAISGTNTLYTDAVNISVLGRVDTMYQLSQLAARVAALEAALIGG